MTTKLLAKLNTAYFLLTGATISFPWIENFPYIFIFASKKICWLEEKATKISVLDISRCNYCKKIGFFKNDFISLFLWLIFEMTFTTSESFSDQEMNPIQWFYTKNGVQFKSSVNFSPYRWISCDLLFSFLSARPRFLEAKNWKLSTGKRRKYFTEAKIATLLKKKKLFCNFIVLSKKY